MNKHSRVLTYINSKLIRLHFLLRRDILNHRDINLLSFFNYSIICFLINIYSDEHQSALKYLKDTEVNLNNVLIMTRDFNIRDNYWNSAFLYYLTHVDTLREIADSLDSGLLTQINQVPI